MDFKLLLPILATVGLVISQESVPLGELLGKCSGVEPGTSISLDADCRTYAVCPERYNLRQFPIRYCSPGALFDISINGCNSADLVDCAAAGLLDPCAGQGDGSIQDVMRSEPARAALLFCEGGRTIGGLSCNACEQYSPNSENGCAPIPDCVRNEPEFACNLNANPENSAQYIALAPGGNIVMNCANGTVFSQESCGCVMTTN